MQKDYQVRVEFESAGSEEVYNFDSLIDAQRGFHSTCTSVGNEQHGDDVHVELVEVLNQRKVRRAE